MSGITDNDANHDKKYITILEIATIANTLSKLMIKSATIISTIDSHMELPILIIYSPCLSSSSL
ncbi:hypothetical protein GCM10008934_33290 [Virgibacillus salarius]